MNTPYDPFDERAREAGRDLRRAAPADGLDRIHRSRRNRRLAQAGGALAVAVLGIGGIVAYARGDRGETIATSDPTVPTSTPPASPPPTSPPTSPTTPPSTASPEPTAPASAWFGNKLIGWYEGVTFVPYEYGSAVPDLLLGAEIDVVRFPASTAQATVTDADCAEPYLAPRPGNGVWLSTDAPTPSAALEPSEHPAALVTALETVGVDPAASRSYAEPRGNRIVLADGYSDTYQYPTWVALWDADTGELTTLEGGVVPDAVEIGEPVGAFYDFDGDGLWEIVYGYGDGWMVRELDTGDQLVFGDAHPCPETTSAGPENLVGEWSLDPDGPVAMRIVVDGTGNHVRFGDSCEMGLFVEDDLVVLSQGLDECLPADADPRLLALDGASLWLLDGQTLEAGTLTGEVISLHRVA